MGLLLGRYRPPLPNGVPGIDFAIGRTSTNTLSVASIGGTPNLPANCSYDSGVSGIRIGSTLSDFTISDWDFRGINACFYLQNSKTITFSQCLFDASNYSVSNVPFMANRSGAPNFKISRCSFDFKNTTVDITKIIGGTCILCEYSDFRGIPIDWADVTPVSGQTTTIQFNRVQIYGGSTAGLHSDGMQLATWNAGDGIVIDGNWISMPTPPVGGTAVDRCISLTGGASGITSPVTVSNNFLECSGAYAIAFIRGSVDDTANVSVTGNYCGGFSTGPLYNGAQCITTLSIPSLRSSVNGSLLTMSYNNGSSTTSTTHIP